MTGRIEFPLAGSRVRASEVVHGFTPFTDRKNYLTVTAVETGTRYIIAEIKAGADGKWTEVGRFGESSSCSKEFIIQIFTTMDVIAINSTSPFPAAGVWSPGTAVTRKCD